MEKTESVIKPMTTYNWDENVEFSFKGNEYGAMFNFVEAYVNSPMHRLSVAAAELHQVMLKKLEDAIISGIAVPVEKEEGK